MPLTHHFKETILARVRRQPKFRQALLREISGTRGADRNPAKSLMRMLSPKGSPSAANLSSILTALKKNEGVYFGLSLRR